MIGPGNGKNVAAVERTTVPVVAVILPTVAVKPLAAATGVPVGVLRVSVEAAVVVPIVVTFATAQVAILTVLTPVPPVARLTI